MEIRALQKKDDRTKFRSGDFELDRFFVQFAGQNQFRLYLGVTYVAVSKGRIHGYVTVSPAHIDAEKYPLQFAKKLPAYPLPVLRLARLAVAEDTKNQGIGEQLLRYSLKLALRIADEYGCTGVLVDAKPQATAFYRKYGFTALDAVAGQSNARPQPVPMFLSIHEIKQAQGARNSDNG